MVKYDIKVFWRYIWHNQIHPKNWMRSSTFYEYIMMLTILYAVIFTDLTLQRKAILFMGFLIGISIIKFYALYKSGFHRHWNRQNYGIPSKNWIKKIKQEKIQEREINKTEIKRVNKQREVQKEKMGETTSQEKEAGIRDLNKP